MFGSVILDVAVGLVVTYLLLSLIASSVREGIESWMKTRAVLLERGIHEMLDDPVLLKSLYEHPQVSSLYRGEFSSAKLGRALPSYIPAPNFAIALLDVAAHAPAGASPAQSDATPLSAAGLRQRFAAVANKRVQRVLLAALDSSNGDMTKVQASVEAWFNTSMDRVTGWYKRETQLIILAVAVVVTIAADVDSVRLANQLYRDQGQRQSAVAMAANVGKDPSAATNTTATDALRSLNEAKLLDPWAHVILDTDSGFWPKVGSVFGHAKSSAIGWLLTALAVSLGAPFWFDVLNRIMTFRSTLKPVTAPPPPPTPSPAPAPAQAAPPAAPQAAVAPPAPAPIPPAPPPNIPVPVTANAQYEPRQWASGRPDGGVI